MTNMITIPGCNCMGSNMIQTKYSNRKTGLRLKQVGKQKYEHQLNPGWKFVPTFIWNNLQKGHLTPSSAFWGSQCCCSWHNELGICNQHLPVLFSSERQNSISLSEIFSSDKTGSMWQTNRETQKYSTVIPACFPACSPLIIDSNSKCDVIHTT